MPVLVLTGGLGKAGKHAIPYLLSKGHKVLNLNLMALDHPDVYPLKINLTDSGQVFNALLSHFNMAGYLGASAKGKLKRVFSLAII